MNGSMRKVKISWIISEFYFSLLPRFFSYLAWVSLEKLNESEEEGWVKELGAFFVAKAEGENNEWWKNRFKWIHL